MLRVSSNIQDRNSLRATNLRYLRLLPISPPHEEPTGAHCGQTRSQQSDRAAIAYAIRRAKLWLVDLRSNNAHQLAARIRDANRQTGRRCSLRSSNTFRPHECEERLRGSGSDHDENILRDWLLDSNEQDVTDDLRKLNRETGDPWRKATDVD